MNTVKSTHGARLISNSICVGLSIAALTLPSLVRAQDVVYSTTGDTANSTPMVPGSFKRATPPITRPNIPVNVRGGLNPTISPQVPRTTVSRPTVATAPAANPGARTSWAVPGGTIGANSVPYYIAAPVPVAASTPPENINAILPYTAPVVTVIPEPIAPAPANHPVVMQTPPKAPAHSMPDPNTVRMGVQQTVDNTFNSGGGIGLGYAQTIGQGYQNNTALIANFANVLGAQVNQNVPGGVNPAGPAMNSTPTAEPFPYRDEPMLHDEVAALKAKGWIKMGKRWHHPGAFGMEEGWPSELPLDPARQYDRDYLFWRQVGAQALAAARSGNSNQNVPAGAQPGGPVKNSTPSTDAFPYRDEPMLHDELAALKAKGWIKMGNRWHHPGAFGMEEGWPSELPIDPARQYDRDYLFWRQVGADALAAARAKNGNGGNGGNGVKNSTQGPGSQGGGAIGTKPGAATSAPVIRIAQGAADAGSVHLSQEFSVEVDIPTAQASSIHMTVRLSNGRGETHDVQLTLTTAVAGGMAHYSSGPISIGGKRGGRIGGGIPWAGTVTFADLKNAEIVYIEVVGAATPMMDHVLVYDNDVEHALGIINDDLRRIMDFLLTQRSAINLLKADAELMADPGRAAEIKMWQDEIDMRIRLHGRLRGLMAGASTPRLKVNYAERLMPVLVEKGRFDERDWTGLASAAQNDAKQNTEDTYVTLAAALARATYAITTGITMTGPTYTAVAGQNIWGQAATPQERVEAAAEVIIAVATMHLLPKVHNYLADRSARGSMQGATPRASTGSPAAGTPKAGSPAGSSGATTVVTPTGPNGTQLMPPGGPITLPGGAAAGGAPGATTRTVRMTPPLQPTVQQAPPPGHRLMTHEELTRVLGAYVRGSAKVRNPAGESGLTQSDVEFIGRQLANDAHYFENLSRAGRADYDGLYAPALPPDAARELGVWYHQAVGH